MITGFPWFTPKTFPVQSLEQPVHIVTNPSNRVNELFVILEGTGEYRFGGETYPVKAGDICAAPAGGPENAHQLINTGTTDLKYLGVSTQATTEVVEYPDSQKFAVTSRFDWSKPDAGGIRFVGRREDSRDYWEGE